MKARQINFIRLRKCLKMICLSDLKSLDIFEDVHTCARVIHRGLYNHQGQYKCSGYFYKYAFEVVMSDVARRILQRLFCLADAYN